MRQTVLETSLSAATVVSQLRAVTRNSMTARAQHYDFEGQVWESGFAIAPLFDSSLRNQLRPELKGTIVPGGATTVILLQINFPKYLRLPFVLIVLLTMAFIVFLYVNPVDELFTWKLYLVLLVVTSLLFYFSFKGKVAATLKILNRILEAEIKK